MNQNPVLTLSNNLMNATDAAFDVIMGRARAKEKAMREIVDMQQTVNIPFQKDKELFKSIEDRYFKDLYDEDGLYNDEFLKNAAAESKLNADLSGFAKGLDQAFDKAPFLKPFYLFARTGVNGIAMTMKYTPGLNLALKKQRDILMASPDNLMKYFSTVLRMLRIWLMRRHYNLVVKPLVLPSPLLPLRHTETVTGQWT